MLVLACPLPRIANYKRAALTLEVNPTTLMTLQTLQRDGLIGVRGETAAPQRWAASYDLQTLSGRQRLDNPFRSEIITQRLLPRTQRFQPHRLKASGGQRRVRRTAGALLHLLRRDRLHLRVYSRQIQRSSGKLEPRTLPSIRQVEQTYRVLLDQLFRLAGQVCGERRRQYLVGHHAESTLGSGLVEHELGERPTFAAGRRTVQSCRTYHKVPRIGLHHELLAGQLRYAIYAKRVGGFSLLVRMTPLPILAPKNVVRREERHAAPDVGSRPCYVECSRRVYREGQRWINLTVVYPVERGRIEHPVWFYRAYSRYDAFFVRHIQVFVRKPYGLLSEHPHEVLPELAGRADDRDRQSTAPSFSTVSFSQRMLK